MNNQRIIAGVRHIIDDFINVLAEQAFAENGRTIFWKGI